uniref:Uncharacterized protein n=1 Tax=Moniliophthora roreri TaxID=221103 RepID=A0A0W0G7P4_MONRR
MGAKYLSRLVRLHLRRRSILMNMLAIEPELHSPTKACGLGAQRELKEKWYMAIALLTPEIKAGHIRELVMAQTNDLTCEECIKARDARLNAILTEWSISVVSLSSIGSKI